METKCYENDFIRIYDTRGIEISKDFDIEKVFNEALKDIKDKYEKNEPDELIHCLLYCFTGTRFEREEGEIIVKLRKTYEGNKLPIILVLTQDLNGNDETDDDNEDDKEEKEGFKQLYEAINKIIKEKFDESLFDNRESITLIQVLAKNKRVSKHTILPKGLDILIQKSFEKGEYYSKFACLSAINISLEKKIIEDYERIKEKILNEKDRFLDVIFQKNKNEKIFEEIIERTFITYSLLNYKQFVIESTFDYIKKTNEKIIKLILEKEEIIFKNILKKKLSILHLL